MELDIPGASIGAMAVAAATFAAARGAEVVQRRRRHGHLYRVASHPSGLDFVLPSVPIREFTIRDPRKKYLETLHSSPGNVLFMPMVEGTSLAKLVAVIRAVHRGVDIDYVNSEAYRETKRSLISIGGPSVNAVSGSLLDKYLPEFEIDYPHAREAQFGTRSFKARFDDDGHVCEDYGFILVVPDAASGIRRVVLWGILAFGTGIAVEALLDLKRHTRDGLRAFAGRRPRLLVASGRVNGLMIEEIDLVENTIIR